MDAAGDVVGEEHAEFMAAIAGEAAAGSPEALAEARARASLLRAVGLRALLLLGVHAAFDAAGDRFGSGR